MSLSAQLRHVDLTLECKYCGRPLTKKGAWFTVVHRFKCEGCNRETPITYSDKIALWRSYGRCSGLDENASGGARRRDRRRA
jgi:hypothetical protein